MDDIRKILVVSRDTGQCKRALRLGIALARKLGAELCVLHVIHNPFGAEGWNLPFLSLESDYRELGAEVREELDKVIASEQARGLPVRELIRTGDPERAILRTVREEKVDLAILVSHTSGMLDHFLYGRTNEEIVRKMPCSILMVKPSAEAWEARRPAARAA